MRYLFTILLMAALCVDTQAQIYNAGVLHITSGTMLSSAGDFTNTSTADFLNNGTLHISGNCINDQASLPAGQGTTIFDGTSPQVLSGAALFRCFSVTLNNAAGLTLSNRLAIGDGTGGVLTFLSGLITTSSPTQDVYFYPGASYTGFDGTHHIRGFVTKSGNTDFTFPIGDGTHTADLDLTALSSTADFQVIYSPSGYGSYNKTSPIVANGVFGKEWWDIHQVSGSASAKVTLKWNDARNVLNHTDPGSLVVGHFTGGSWQSEGGSSSDGPFSSTGSVGPSNAVSTFSPFTFASTSVGLPITLGAFTVTDKDCQALLTWNTQIEENAAGFDIQQSVDAATYTSVAYAAAKNTPSTYSVTVAQSTRQAYYRIHMLDRDGSAVYSPVAALQLNCIGNSEYLRVFPDPQIVGVDATVQYTTPAARGTALLQLFDMGGKRVYSAVIQVNAGVNSYNLPTSSLATGSYTLQVTGTGWKSGHANLLLRRN